MNNIVLIGMPGSGKSTVVNLMPRLYDVNGGAVRIAGIDVRDFDLTYLREQIGVVTGKAKLPSGTPKQKPSVSSLPETGISSPAAAVWSNGPKTWSCSAAPAGSSSWTGTSAASPAPSIRRAGLC